MGVPLYWVISAPPSATGGVNEVKSDVALFTAVVTVAGVSGT